MVSKKLLLLFLVLLADSQEGLSYTLLVWLLLKEQVGADAYSRSETRSVWLFPRLPNRPANQKLSNSRNKNETRRRIPIYPQPQGKTTMQEISTSNKARLRQFDFAFARFSNCTACTLSVVIVAMVMCGRHGEATTLGLAARVFGQAAQTSAEIGKAGTDKSSSVQSEDKSKN
jgi:hypothetical protein